MSDPFAHEEATARFEMNGAFSLFWPYLLSGGLLTLGALAGVLNLAPGVLPPPPPQVAMLVGGIGLILLGVAGRKDWVRVKWIEAANRAGIRWYARGREWQHTWDQLTHIDTRAKVRADAEGGLESLSGHRMTVTFTDGATFRLRFRECGDYKILLQYLQAKHEQTRAARLTAQYVASLSENQKAADDRVTTFGPLGIYRGGVEWDGIYFPWEQVEGFLVEEGMLLIRTWDGDEFLRRTADLGDWQTAVGLLEAAAGEPAAPRAASDA